MPRAEVPVVRIAQAQVTPVPTIERELHSIATPTPVDLAEETPPAGTAPVPSPIRHTATAEIDYAAKQVRVAQTIRYFHPQDETLTDLALNVEANNWFNGFTLEMMRVDGAEAAFTLTDNRIDITLPKPALPGSEIVAELTFWIRLPRIEGGIFASRGFFGYTDRQINLSHWLPTVAPRIHGEWVIHQPIFVGEQIVLNLADWDVTLTAVNAPAGLEIAAPGMVENVGPTAWRVIHSRSRDFSLSFSDQFRRSRRETKNGLQIELYSFEDSIVQTTNGSVDAADHALLMAVRSAEMFSDLFGPPPHDRLVIVQGDFPDGMEFSGMVFVGGSYFRGFQGDPTSWLTLITVHEVAHQWWYGRVGNDPALDPWLDEALATYSEIVYIEEFYPVLKDWWWSFRVNNYFPTGAVDSTVYEFSSPREYINAVYLRGVLLLDALRDDLGTDAFFDWLARYAAAADGQIATPALFWSLLSEDQMRATERTRSFYLRRPDGE